MVNQNFTTHYVILAVDTVGLSQNYDEGQTDLNDYCRFVGQNPDDNIELFTTEVGKGDEIEWSGFSTSGNSDNVKIVKIEIKPGKIGLESSFQESPDQNKKKKKVKANKKNDWGKYDLSFQINGTGTTYKIDPIINVYK